jgi:Fis family transcriptional regulator, factor for inversion stimulation protein
MNVPHESSELTHSALRDTAARAVRRYLRECNGNAAEDLHRIVMSEVERPLLTEVITYCAGNLSRAAAVLGINRATLRKKLDDYGIDTQ